MKDIAVGQSWLNADGFIVTVVDQREDGRFKIDMDGNLNGTLNRTYSVDADGRALLRGPARNRWRNSNETAAQQISAFDLVERAPRVYIAGPMSGLPELNFPAFNAAAKEYRRKGRFVLNPAEIAPHADTPWLDCMRKDIAALVTCEGVVMLPGWEKSKGATLEHHIAVTLGLTITYREI